MLNLLKETEHSHLIDKPSAIFKQNADHEVSREISVFDFLQKCWPFLNCFDRRYALKLSTKKAAAQKSPELKDQLQGVCK